MRRFVVLALAGVWLLLTPATALASIGVGVGTGKISVREPLRAGGIYKLPPVTVFNTGTQTATYEMLVTLNEKQARLKPDPAWFSFSPSKFTLEPNHSQTVTPTFHPPLIAEPGDYFAYLEARPAKTVRQGGTLVGVAAATKLNFTVTSSNVFVGLWYRLKYLYAQWWPWDVMVMVAILIAVTYLVLRRYVRIQITRPDKRKRETHSTEDNPEE